MTHDTLMLREIREAPEAVERQSRAIAATLADLAASLRASRPRLVVTIARGSSDHAALYLKHLVEIGLGLPCCSIGPSIASVYGAPLDLDGAVAIIISQSGRSPDIVALQQAAKRGRALCVALVNDATSPAAEAADWLIPLSAGPERAVAATKSMIAALTASAALVAAWGDNSELIEGVAALPRYLTSTATPPLESAIKLMAEARSTFVLGRGATFGIAAEAALKLKETSAIHAEGFSSAEVMHGPAALVGPGFPIIGFVPQDSARAGMREVMRGFARMGAACLSIDTEISEGITIAVPAATHPALTPIGMLHAFYMLAEAVARRRGCDPDNPPHLAKITRTV